MFEKELKVIEEIERLKEKYKLDATQVFTLRFLKLSEIHNMNYESIKKYFIEMNENKNEY